jgi:hypothetical protein
LGKESPGFGRGSCFSRQIWIENEALNASFSVFLAAFVPWFAGAAFVGLVAVRAGWDLLAFGDMDDGAATGAMEVPGLFSGFSGVSGHGSSSGGVLGRAEPERLDAGVV